MTDRGGERRLELRQRRGESVGFFALRCYASLMTQMGERELLANAAWIASKSASMVDAKKASKND